MVLSILVEVDMLRLTTIIKYSGMIFDVYLFSNMQKGSCHY